MRYWIFDIIIIVLNCCLRVFIVISRVLFLLFIVYYCSVGVGGLYLIMEEEAMFMCLLMCTSVYYLMKKSRRRFAVRPINRARKEKGMFNNLLTSMLIKKDTEQFFKYTRMEPKLFFKLLKLVKGKLQKDQSKNPIPPPHRLILTLQ